MYTYISQDKPNRARQPELDLSKFIAIFLMIVCHCGIYYFDSDTAAYLICDMLGGEFAAPVFMVCMGIGIVFSRHNRPDLLIKRGLKLLIMSYVLNFIRGTIPEIISALFYPDGSIWGIPPSFYMVDIMNFAGLAMMLMGLLKKWKVEPAYQVLIALLMSGVGETLAWVSTGLPWLDAVCDLIWGAGEWSYFPLLNWFIFPAAGVFFGEILMHCNDKDELYRRLLPIGLVGVALSYYLIFTQGESYYSGDSYYFMGLKNAVLTLCYPMLSFSVCYFLTEKIHIGTGSFVTYSSRNLNTLYCISWVLIFWIRLFIIKMLNLPTSGLVFAVFTLVVLAGSYALCQVWQTIKIKRAAKRESAG